MLRSLSYFRPSFFTPVTTTGDDGGGGDDGDDPHKPLPVMKPRSTTLLRHADLTQSSFLLKRAGEFAAAGRHQDAEEYYRVCLSGMLGAAREDDGSVGETASKLLAKALVEARQMHEASDSEVEEEEESDEATVFGSGSSTAGDLILETEEEDETPAPLPEISLVDDDDEDKPSTSQHGTATPSQPVPFGVRVIDFVILLVRTLLSTPFVYLLYSTQRYFLHHLYHLSEHYNLRATVVEMTRVLGYIAGWCDRRLGLGQRMGELGAVCVVGMLKGTETVLREVAVRIEQVERHERARLTSQAAE